MLKKPYKSNLQHRIFAVFLSASLIPLSSLALEILKGKDAMGDWKKDAPGVTRLITHDHVLAPYESPSASNRSTTVAKPSDSDLKTMAGFNVEIFASNVDGARVIRQAPNGDIFVSQSRPGNVRIGDSFQFQNGKISVIRSSADGRRVQKIETFLVDLKQPYGMAFYPPGPNPQWLYVGMQGQVVRYPYNNGDMKSSGEPEVILRGLPVGGHWTRDIGFSLDGKTLFLALGSASNIAVDMEDRPSDLKAWEKVHGLGGAWGNETDRATVLAFSPDGKNRRVYATGIRNCSGLTIQPTSGEVYCSTNERDLMGDNTPPDYVSSIKEGHFYGWPWIYHKDYEDLRPAGGPRPDLKGKATMPDVLIQSHSAPLGMDFNPGGMFPAEWTGDAFAALHGSWNRALHTGYKVIRLPAKSNQLDGTYQDFVTGFAAGENAVWGRPVNVKFLKDGSMLFSEDVNGTIYRVTYKNP